VPRPAAEQAPRRQPGCLGGLWLIYKMPFQFLWRVPRLGAAFRHTAATTAGIRAKTSYHQLTPPADRAACAAVLAEVRSHDAGFDLAATARGVVRARQIVDQARLAGDASAARQVLSDGLWQVFVMILDSRAAHNIRRQGTSTVVEAKVAAATRDQLAEQLRLRLKCSGERSEVAGEHVLRGNGIQGTWHDNSSQAPAGSWRELNAGSRGAWSPGPGCWPARSAWTRSRARSLPRQLSRSATASMAGSIARSPALPKPITSAGGAAVSGLPR
jgi:hypothetical protein